MLPLNMVEESIRVPMTINQPGRVFAGQRRSEMVDHLDLFLTLLDFASVSPSEDRLEEYLGRSFLPVLENSGSLPDWRYAQFGEYGNLRMIRTNAHKLICRYPDGPHELFDLQSDPREQVNCIALPEKQMLLQQLKNRLEDHFSKFEDSTKSGLRVRELPQHNFTDA